MNVADSDTLAELLSMRGYSAASDAGSADLVVVNTCSVREHAEKRAKARIAHYAGRKAAGAALWVVGCMAERMGDSLRSEIRGVDQVIGATRIEHLSHDLDRYLGELASQSDTAVSAAPGVSMFLPIMRGCDNYCAYCVVPYVRGREHSIAKSVLLDKARRMARQGVKEITLLGQNVNSYRDGDTDFAALLRLMHDVEGIVRIRFTTSHPKDCSEKLVRTVAELPKLCSHFHLPIQSGSSRILERMNRTYTCDDYLRRVDTIRSLVADVDITTDIMVGFPAETDDDFRQTLSLVDLVRFTSAFMFAYSERDGTAAASMDGQVPQQEKKRRLEELITLQTAITKECYASMVGRTVDVLFTERQKRRDRAWMGQDAGCKRVLVRCEESLAGTILPMKIARSTGMTLIGERPAQCDS